ncbi:hypothetical protein EVAR_57468_1 [Eumeta japonica]|uniref:Uncharacterized protein n=1 Tax=Eumeta variegata TaxID=151549 RepID=A0A4C1ZF11_EUMVA|nr:hypothetical protein EVAR_57468_1 [Eumeta japonica]
MDDAAIKDLLNNRDWEFSQSVPRVFWRTKEMNTRGPDIADDLLLPQDKLGLLQYRLNLATAMAKYDGETVNPIYSRSNSRGGADTDSREIPSTSRNQDVLPKKKHRVIVAQPCPDQSSSEMGYHHLFEVPDNISNRVLQMCTSHLDSRLSIRDCIFILKLHLHHRSHFIAVLLRSSQGDQLEMPHIDSSISLDGTPEVNDFASLAVSYFLKPHKVSF